MMPIALSAACTAEAGSIAGCPGSTRQTGSAGTQYRQTVQTGAAHVSFVWMPSWPHDTRVCRLASKHVPNAAMHAYIVLTQEFQA